MFEVQKSSHTVISTMPKQKIIKNGRSQQQNRQENKQMKINTEN